MNKVIIDTDFLNHILKTPNGEAIMRVIREFYDFEFIMHPWVYEREIKGISTTIEEFVKNNVHVLKYEDFIKDKDDDALYLLQFEVLFHEMNRRPIDMGISTYRTYKRSGENLGEIHSVILSMLTNIPVLLSDDHNAREIAAKRINNQDFELKVKQSFETLCEIAKQDKTLIDRESVIQVIRQYKPEYQKERIKYIKKIYAED